MSGRDWVRRGLYGAAGVLVGVALVLPTVTGTEQLEPAPFVQPLPAGEAVPTAPGVVPEVGVDGRLLIPSAGLNALLELMELPADGRVWPPTSDAAYSLTGMPAAWPEHVIVLHSSRSHAGAVGDLLLDSTGTPKLEPGAIVWLGTERMRVAEVVAIEKSSTVEIIANHTETTAAIVTCAQDDASTRPSGSPAAANAVFFLEAAPL